MRSITAKQVHQTPIALASGLCDSCSLWGPLQNFGGTARLAANTRHHPERTEGDRQLLNAAVRERRLREVLGPPPKGTNWIDQVRRLVDDCPPLTTAQREKLTLLLQPLPGNSGGT